ncbi:hypothetical protein [Actinoplanes sp. HUAS TT8]|uniref:hypothetical protein n=1 Tax=Actinoplanes sp. HUAS TT8 TaxID=3447453 RepID=UPI003F51B717
MRSDDGVAGLGPDLRYGAAQTGTDDDGVVLVRVAADGAVLAVEINRRWGERLRGVDALAAAVLAAYRQALLKRMAARLVNGPTVAETPERPGVDDPGWLRGVRDALDRAHQQLTAVPRDETVTGPARLVRVAGGAAAEREPGRVAEDARIALDRARNPRRPS